MSDYSFMKSGFNNLEENDKYDPNDLVAIILHFIENATRSAGIYVKHSNRNSVTPEDIKRGMMLEIFLFSKRMNIEQNIIDIKNDLENNNFDDDGEDAVDFCPEDEMDSFQESPCNCAMCKCLNTIYTRWEKWTPVTEIEHILKKHIEEI